MAESTPGRHLDFGSYDGHVPQEFIRSGAAKTAVAADVVDARANYDLRFGVRPPPDLRFVAVDAGSLDLPDQSFDSITLLDVLEHVTDQVGVLQELHRLLRPGGILVVTVPARHVFSALDTGNWKFRFPEAHRLFYSTLHGMESYEKRYRNPSSGLIGDIEVEKSWHEHFTASTLTSLLRRCQFEPIDLDGAGTFTRPLALLRYALPARVEPLLNRALDLDARCGLIANLFSTSLRKE